MPICWPPCVNAEDLCCTAPCVELMSPDSVAATLMLNNGVPLEVVSTTLGHAGLAITADVYAKVGAKLQRTAADTMQEVLGQ